MVRTFNWIKIKTRKGSILIQVLSLLVLLFFCLFLFNMRFYFVTKFSLFIYKGQNFFDFWHKKTNSLWELINHFNTLACIHRRRNRWGWRGARHPKFWNVEAKKKRIKVTFIYLCKKGRGGGGAKLRGLRDATIWRRWVLFYTLYNYRNSRGKEKA